MNTEQEIEKLKIKIEELNTKIYYQKIEIDKINDLLRYLKNSVEFLKVKI